MALDPSMQQVVEVALNIPPTTPLTPDEILALNADYIRSKRNIALDRVAFDECHQSTSESFEDFYIRPRRLADVADLCGTWQASVIRKRRENCWLSISISVGSTSIQHVQERGSGEN